ncbi:MAG: dTDP-4-dehydrorhamnose reductase [Pseudomonadota bacterium]
MKLLLLGPNGQVGWELQRALAPVAHVLAADRKSVSLPGDLEFPDALSATLRSLQPDVIVNAAAYTAVDAAETDIARARLINAAAPGILAAHAAASASLLIHYSTDYVFDGSGTQAWREGDHTGPLNVYGASKLEGEHLIRSSGCRHLIFRTSWVYANRGENFLRTMLRLATERERLSVVDDQHGAPTSAELIADVTAHVLRVVTQDPRLEGTYHLVAAGVTNWHHYARHAIDEARRCGHPVRVADEAIVPCSSADFPTAARRPRNSRLATDKLRDVFGLTLPSWQQGVTRTVRELCSK